MKVYKIFIIMGFTFGPKVRLIDRGIFFSPLTQNGRKCQNTWLAGKIKCGCCGYALASLNAPNGVTYLRCKQRSENKGCQGAGTLTKQLLEQAVYEEMVKKMRVFQTLKGGKTASYNPKLVADLTANSVSSSQVESISSYLRDWESVGFTSIKRKIKK